MVLGVNIGAASHGRGNRNRVARVCEMCEGMGVQQGIGRSREGVREEGAGRREQGAGSREQRAESKADDEAGAGRASRGRADLSGVPRLLGEVADQKVGGDLLLRNRLGSSNPATQPRSAAL